MEDHGRAGAGGAREGRGRGGTGMVKEVTAHTSGGEGRRGVRGKGADQEAGERKGGQGRVNEGIGIQQERQSRAAGLPERICIAEEKEADRGRHGTARADEEDHSEL